MPDLIRIDPYAREAWAGDRLLDLTPAPWRLLAALVASAGTVRTWESLAAAMTVDRPIAKGNVKTVAARVRRELGHPAYVRTVRRVGLCFAADLAEDVYVGREVAGDGHK